MFIVTLREELGQYRDGDSIFVMTSWCQSCHACVKARTSWNLRLNGRRPDCQELVFPYQSFQQRPANTSGGYQSQRDGLGSLSLFQPSCNSRIIFHFARPFENAVAISAPPDLRNPRASAKNPAKNPDTDKKSTRSQVECVRQLSTGITNRFDGK